ncbi:conjugal transfer protein TraH [Orientia tsutsugamushi]|uniref:Conjugal transfer protein TraH n=1 Tax=Orientia tsutsugamushi TaxID=784 RepID=A0A2R8F444_ORITS|nr:conjugal transfer protein TraH [Orientia tsutsugamushi]
MILAQKQALRQAQNNDSELMLDDYNIFTKTAAKVGILPNMHDSIMSMTGTIIVTNNNRPLSKLVKVVQNYKCKRSN